MRESNGVCDMEEEGGLFGGKRAVRAEERRQCERRMGTNHNIHDIHDIHDTHGCRHSVMKPATSYAN